MRITAKLQTALWPLDGDRRSLTELPATDGSELYVCP